MASIEHQLSARVTLRVPSKRGYVPYFKKAVQLSEHPSMRELTISSLTGSIILHRDEPWQPIATVAADQKLFKAGRLEPQGDGSESEQLSGLRQGSGIAGGLAAGLNWTLS
jgi:hypothetical protein